MYKGEVEISVKEVITFLDMLDSRIDDLKDRIKSTNRDWFDLLSKEEQDKIKSEANPEDKSETDIDNQWNFGIFDEFSDFIDIGNADFYDTDFVDIGNGDFDDTDYSMDEHEDNDAI